MGHHGNLIGIYLTLSNIAVEIMNLALIEWEDNADMQQLTELWKSIHLAQKRFTSAMDGFRNIILHPFRPLRPDSSSSPKSPVADW